MSPLEAKAYGLIDEVYTEREQSLISEAKREGGLGGEGGAAHEGEDVKPADEDPTAEPSKGTKG